MKQCPFFLLSRPISEMAASIERKTISRIPSIMAEYGSMSKVSAPSHVRNKFRQLQNGEIFRETACCLANYKSTR